MVRRLVWVALAAGAACSDISKVPSGPTDSFYRPMGIGVQAGSLVVASSNIDLLYDSATGGSVISVDTATDRRQAGLNIESFAGHMAIADPNDPRVLVPANRCPIPGPLALVPVRGADRLYRIPLGAGGALACDGCSVALAGHEFADAFSVGVACGPGIARAYVGYLRSTFGRAWITQVDLTKPDLSVPGAVQHNVYGLGQVRGFAYDSDRKRIYLAHAGQGIRWIDLANDCAIDAAWIDGGCMGGVAALPVGIEPRAIALSRPDAPVPNRRLYVLARVYDSRAAAGAGVQVGDVDAALLVTELVDDAAGQTQVHLLDAIRVGYGPVDLALLPGRPGRRDVVAALAGDDPGLLLYDDDTGDTVSIGRDLSSLGAGHPWLGAQPFGLAVDPVQAGGLAHLYVGSSAESFVSRIDVPLADINQTVLPQPGGTFLRIGSAL